MDENTEIEAQIAGLPLGYITKRKIGEKTYFYHQGTENGKPFSKTVAAEDVPALQEKIDLRKTLEKRLKEQGLLPKKKPAEPHVTEKQRPFLTNVTYGDALADFVASAADLQKRDCYGTVSAFLNGRAEDKVCAVYGLRRTGKTTLLKQLLLDFGKEQFAKSAYIKATTFDTIANVNKDLVSLRDAGYRYLFIDEVTLIQDFIDAASLFSDVYAAQGIKIVLSGTDSLGFYFASRDELYDRVLMVHTTYIPFKEHSRLLGINDIDEYIRYGGTLKAGELAFEDEEVNAADASFRDDETTRRYIDTAICTNIQHSLEYFKDGRYFRHLKALYDADELTNAINRIIESMNHDFTVKVITGAFKSHDLRSAAQLLRSARDEEKRTDVLDSIDTTAVLDTLKKILSIKEKESLEIGITDAHIAEIREYLKALDLIEITQIETAVPDSPELEYVIFTQPGMRFCQAQALVYALIKDREIRRLDNKTRALISEKILEDVKGRMLEDMVLLETRKSFVKNWKNKKEVFKLRFATGEYDMVIYDNETLTCEAYEIKHTAERTPAQYRHLVDADEVAQTEHLFGTITKKAVLYKGENHAEPNGIVYQNVEEYLKQLS